MGKLVKESEYLLAWFLFWICATIGGFILGAVGGGIVGFFLGAAGVDLNTIKLICGGVGLILGIPLSYILFRAFVGAMIVKKAEARFQRLEPHLSNQRFESSVGSAQQTQD